MSEQGLCSQSFSRQERKKRREWSLGSGDKWSMQQWRTRLPVACVTCKDTWPPPQGESARHTLRRGVECVHDLWPPSQQVRHLRCVTEKHPLLLRITKLSNLPSMKLCLCFEEMSVSLRPRFLHYHKHNYVFKTFQKGNFSPQASLQKAYCRFRLSQKHLTRLL